MTHAKKLFIIMLLLLVSFVSASNLKIGFYIGANEFLTQSEVWDLNDLYEHYQGYYFFDESGSSIQLGTQMFIKDHVALTFQFRTPRRGMSYFYFSDRPIRPGVIPETITVVRSYVTSINSEVRYFPIRHKKITPYIGIGGELALLNAGDFVPTDERYIGDWRLVPDHFFVDMGTKVLGGLILPAGMLINITEHITFDIGLNYTFMHIRQWDATGDIPVEQDMSGLYLKIGTGYNL